MRVAVTGSTGLVGMNLAGFLAHAGSPPRCLVRPASNLAHLLSWRVEPWTVDFTSVEDLVRALGEIEVLIHAAYDPANFERLRVEPLYRAAGRAGVRHFVYFSSSAVHDIQSGNLLREDHPPRLDHPYSRFKYGEERFLAESGNEIGVPWTVLRPGNVYGPWDLKGFMFRWFETAAGGSVLIAGSGRNRIHFCHVDNLVDLTRRVLLNEAAFGEVFFAADRRATELLQVWRTIAGAFGQKLRHLRVPLGVVRQMRRLSSRLPMLLAPLQLPPKLGALSRLDYELSTEHASEVLGYEPAVGFEDGIFATAGWYRSFGIL